MRCAVVNINDILIVLGRDGGGGAVKQRGGAYSGALLNTTAM